LLFDPANNRLTFLATNTTLYAKTGSPLLPDGAYVVTVHATAATDGIQAQGTGGGYLDGLHTGAAGSGDYTSTFGVDSGFNQDMVWVPATVDGPGQMLSAPGMNRAGGGYPIYLSDRSGIVTSVQATLEFDPTLLYVTGVTGPNFSLRRLSPGNVVLQYNGPALPAGSQTLVGFITAVVSGGTPMHPVPYRATDLLHLSNVTVNGGLVYVKTSDGVHVVAYAGDADGNGNYSSNDAMLITRVLLRADTGFAAYPLVDPVIVVDTDGTGFIPADAALQVNEAGVGVPTATLPSPPIPAGVHFQAAMARAYVRPSIQPLQFDGVTFEEVSNEIARLLKKRK
jgi:hypothetical protein